GNTLRIRKEVPGVPCRSGHRGGNPGCGQTRNTKALADPCPVFTPAPPYAAVPEMSSRGRREFHSFRCFASLAFGLLELPPRVCGIQYLRHLPHVPPEVLAPEASAEGREVFLSNVECPMSNVE